MKLVAIVSFFLAAAPGVVARAADVAVEDAFRAQAQTVRSA